MNADRHYAVASILFDYLKSPSLRHLREPHSVHKVSREIVKALDGASSVWKKWESQREEVAQAAALCWIRGWQQRQCRRLHFRRDES